MTDVSTPKAYVLNEEAARIHPARWATVSSIAAKIGCTAQSLNEWVKNAEVESGVRAGFPAEIAERLKALDTEGEGRGTSAGEGDPIEPPDRRVIGDRETAVRHSNQSR